MMRAIGALAAEGKPRKHRTTPTDAMGRSPATEALMMLISSRGVASNHRRVTR